MRHAQPIRLAVPALLLVLGVAACQGPVEDSVSLQLRTLNDSGVSGTVTLTAIAAGTTRVDVEVDPAGHPDMPAHIHPGTCDDLVPQPRYPLANVVDGHSTSEVPASLAELTAGDAAVNLHASNSEMERYTACVDLGG